MTALKIMAAGIVILAAVTGVLVHRAITMPEQDWHQRQMIERPAGQTPGVSHVRVRARITRRDVREVNERITRLLEENGAQYSKSRPVNHRFEIWTESRETAQTLAALDANGQRLTPAYRDWPDVGERPAVPQGDVYQVVLSVRPTHRSPNTVRAAVAAGGATLALAVATAWVINARLDRRAKQANVPT